MKPNGFRISQGRDGQWYWCLCRQGRIIADGGEGYATKRNAQRAVRHLVDWVRHDNGYNIPVITRAGNKSTRRHTTF